MGGAETVVAFIQIIVAGLNEFGSGFATFLQNMVSNLLYQTVGTTTSLSPLAAIIAVFGALTLSFTATRWIVNFVVSFGRRNR